MMADMDDPTDYGSIVRNNLMKRPGYAPYCMGCSSMSRMVWDGEQFTHPCGTRTEFPADFIAQFKVRRVALAASVKDSEGDGA
jgi:hypothetical protein